MSPHRANDPEGMTIDRKIPLWGVLCVVGAFIGQGALVWNGQNLQAAELRHQSEQIHNLADQVKLIAAKDAVDIKQDFRIDELERRILTVETAKGVRP
jgi:hypothetical protein